MDKCRLQVKAAIIYLSLMFPESARHRLLSLLLPEEKVKEMSSFDDSFEEYLRANVKTTIENYTESEWLSEQPNGDQMSDSVVFTFLDTLFNNKSEVDLVVRSRILASTRTLCAAYRMAYGNNELGLTLQQAYDVLSLVAGTQPIDFTTGDNFYYGSYIGIDCLSSEELIQEQIDFTSGDSIFYGNYNSKDCLSSGDLIQQQDEQSPLEEDVLCRKLPRFSYMIEGQEKEYLEALYFLLSDKDHLGKDRKCLFTREACPLDNFLAMFEGVVGYEDKKPHYFCATSSIDFWAVFFSTIYSGRQGFILLDGKGTKLSRGAKRNKDGLSISEFAQSIIRDHDGKKISSPSTFDRGSGGGKTLIDSSACTEWEQKYKKILQEARNKIMPPSKIHEKLNSKVKK